MQNKMPYYSKNPELGKVKTRLAKTIGNETLEIYKNFDPYPIYCKSN
jgi:hypothetical protein